MTDESFRPIIGIRRQINGGPWEDVEPERAARLGKLIAGEFEAGKAMPPHVVLPGPNRYSVPAGES